MHSVNYLSKASGLETPNGQHSEVSSIKNGLKVPDGDHAKISPTTNGVEALSEDYVEIRPKTNGLRAPHEDHVKISSKANGLKLSNGDHVEKSTSKAPQMPIAIVGMACRFPGDATSPQKLWDMCREGRSAWSEMPKDRFSTNAFWHPNPSKNGCFNVRGGHFLKEDLSLFDAAFFNITPNEAKAMDPQQRILLECTYEALENGGIPIQKIAGSATGVFVGANGAEYLYISNKDTENTPTYSATGSAESILSNRLSYFFDLKGPSMTIDTACSSSLTALNLACQSINQGEVDQAIVGGAYIMFSFEKMISMSLLRLFNEEGKSYAFDHRGTGYGRGEGVATIVIKSLDKALRDGDNIRAVIRASGINQDGRTAGLNYPSQESQRDLIKSVYSTAGIDLRDTAYIEAHGTGTEAGDFVEANAIQQTLSSGRSMDDPLIVGSVKTNIGHAEAASGLASVIKTVYMLEAGLIPPNLNFEKANERIPLRDWSIRIPTTLLQWPSVKRQASISNYGFGGSNAHVILENSPLSLPRNESSRNQNGVAFLAHQKKRLYVLTAADAVSAKSQMLNLATYLKTDRKKNETDMMANLAFTLGQRRSLLAWRLALPAASEAELISSLESEHIQPAKKIEKPRVAFIFSGQGAQWNAMGRELLEDYPIFAETIHEVDECLKSLGASWCLREELLKEKASSRVNYAYISQVATAALQIGIVRLLFAWGINPTAVQGNSSGEIAAAFAAGALTLKSCIAIAYYRGIVVWSLKEKHPNREGAMLAVGASAAEAEAMLKQIVHGKAVIGVIASPALVTATGDAEAIDELQQIAREKKLFSSKIHVDAAYHSHHMQDIASDYLIMLGDIKPKSSSMTYYSSSEGRQVDTQTLGSAYWVENLVSKVELSSALEDLVGSGPEPKIDTVIEIGAHPALELSLSHILAKRPKLDGKTRYLSSLKRGQNSTDRMIELAASLFTMGFDVDLSAVNFPHRRSSFKVLDDLPSYPFTHKNRHWHESDSSHNSRLNPFNRHDLLGTLSAESNTLESRWRNILRVEDVPWLLHHRIQSSTIFPFAGYLTMAIEAAYQHAVARGTKFTHDTKYEFRNIIISRSLVLEDNCESEITVTLRPYSESARAPSDLWDEFVISSSTEGRGWSENCRGLVAIAEKGREMNVVDGERVARDDENFHRKLIAERNDACITTTDPAKTYEKLNKQGLEYGATFQAVCEARVCPNRCAGTILMPDTAKFMPHGFESHYIVHPATLDSALHTIFFAVIGYDPDFPLLNVPTSIKHLTISNGLLHMPGHHLQVYTTTRANRQSLRVDASLFITDPTREQNAPVMDLQGYVGSGLRTEAEAGHGTLDKNLCFKFQYEPHLDFLHQHNFEKLLPSVSQQKRLHMSNEVRITERATYYYIERALDAISEIQLETLEGHYQRLVKYLQNQVNLGREGRLPLQEADWLDCAPTDREIFLESCESLSDATVLACAVGKRLPQILREAIQPASIMATDGILDNYYSKCTFVQQSYAVAACYIAILGHQNPQMKVIELCGGTAHATVPILESLSDASGLPPRFGSYHFTNASTQVLESARVTLNAWGELIKYSALNIDNDPIDQEFETGTFDLVIAAYALHGKSQLQRIRQLLKPGGKFVLLEHTPSRLSTNMVFGTLPAWWNEDDEPLLTEDQWDQYLRHAGFSGLDGCISDGLEEHERMASVFFSTAITNEIEDIPMARIITDGKTGGTSANVEKLLEKCKDLSPTATDLTQMILKNRFLIFLELDQSILARLVEDQLSMLKNLFANSKGILWVIRSTNTHSAMALGLARTIRAENAGVKFVTLDLSTQYAQADSEIAETIMRVYRKSFGSAASGILQDCEFFEIEGCIQIPRVVTDDEKNRLILREIQPLNPESQPFIQQSRPLQLVQDTPGLLDSLHFAVDERVNMPLENNEVEICVKATGMNFKDVMLSLGQIPYEPLGLECAGVVNAVGNNVSGITIGDRVCAVTQGSFANYARTKDHAVQRIPDQMSFTNAASIPIIFNTVYYALINIARLAPEESILIHAAAGGVGQAAIMLAQTLDAEIFATVGSTEKKQLIMDIYGIAEDHIFSSRETTFSRGVMRATGGKGVDVILNSISGDAHRMTWDCIAPLGRFIEIGKRDILRNTRLEMSKFLDTVTFASLDLGSIQRHKPEIFKKLFADVMRLHRTRAVKAVSPITVYPMSKIESALRLMQTGKHMGKIVIEAQPGDHVMAIPQPLEVTVIRPDASYLITGGTGGIGRSLTRWLVQQGAKYIILASRSGAAREEVKDLINELGSLGAKVEAFSCDISSEEQMQDMIGKSTQTMPAIRGVIHSAMVLRDILFEKASVDDYNEVVRPKVQGAWNLHNCLSKTDLDFFVMLSSVAGIVGNYGQAAYNASNAFLDDFARYRMAQGLPAASIDIGAVEDIGYIAENKNKRRFNFDNLGRENMIQGKELLALVKAAIENYGQNCDWRQTVTCLDVRPGSRLPPWTADPRFSHLARRITSSSAKTAQETRGASSMKQLLQAAPSANDAAAIVCKELIRKLAGILMVSTDDISASEPLTAYGGDSLAAIELRNWAARNFDANVPMLTLMTSPSLLDLAQQMVAKSTLVAFRAKDDEEDDEDDD